MNKVLTAAEMAATDKRTEEEFGIPLPSLMEAAGAAVARFCIALYPDAKQVTVLAGKGNNGGDGLVAARYLAGSGHVVTVLLLAAEGTLNGPATEVLKQLRECDSPHAVRIAFCPDEASLYEEASSLEGADLLLDAIVGTGFKAPLRGIAAVLCDRVALLETPMVAIDLPSGWDADSTAQQAEGAFRADAVVTFTAPKFAHLFGHMTFGPVVVAEIGSPEAAVQSQSGLTWAGASKSIAEARRGVDANKGKFGHVLLAGGSYGTFGAPSMSSLAALRTGAGLVTAAVPRAIMNEVGLITPELMVRALWQPALPVRDEAYGTASVSNLDPEQLERLMKGISVLAIGPGLSTRGPAPEFARGLLAKTTVPAVVDADALNAFAGHTDLLKQAANGGKRTLVLTPHPGEMARLANLTVKEVEADRIGLARRFATEHQVTLILKGWRTLIAHPDGRIAVNTTGNPSMAKGGSGDVLTGIVAAMLSQYPHQVAEAVEAAVYLHGLAGDFAARDLDEHTVLATDTIAHLTNAFRYRVKDRQGFTWIAGLQKA
jgi:NAD(P)H-hydrate epimerase